MVLIFTEKPCDRIQFHGPHIYRATLMFAVKRIYQIKTRVLSKSQRKTYQLLYASVRSFAGYKFHLCVFCSPFVYHTQLQSILPIAAKIYIKYVHKHIYSHHRTITAIKRHCRIKGKPEERKQPRQNGERSSVSCSNEEKTNQHKAIVNNNST